VSRGANPLAFSTFEVNTLIWAGISAVGRLAALNLGGSEVAGGSRGSGAPKITWHRVSVAFRRLLLLVALAGGSWLLTAWVISLSDFAQAKTAVGARWLAIVIGMGLVVSAVRWYIRILIRVQREVNLRRAAAQTESERRKAESGKPAGKSSWLASPLASPEAREIAAHLTKAERSEAALYGILWGVWVVTATFGNFWLVKSFPAPGSWIVAFMIALLFIASLPPMIRIQRRFLCSTEWAKECGYTAGQIKLFSFSRRNVLRAGVVFVAFMLFAFLLGKMILHLSGTSELLKSINEQVARSTSAAFHYRVFEADAALVDRLIPAGQRQHGVQSTAKAYVKYGDYGGSKMVNNGTNSFKVTINKGPEIASWVVQISPETLAALLGGIGNKPGILAEGTQTISGVWWPRGMPTIWTYIQQDGVLSGSGDGAIYLAIRRLNGQNEIRIEGEIHHSTDLNEIVGVTSKFLYEGNASQGGALTFLVPFFRKDNSEHYLVVVYEVDHKASATVAPNLSFGPVVERVIQARETGTNLFLNLDTGELLTPPVTMSEMLGRNERSWEALDIPEDSRLFRYIHWLRESGADLMFAGNDKVIGFDGEFPIAHGNNSTNWENWDDLTPAQIQNDVAVIEWGRKVNAAKLRNLPWPEAPKPGGVINSAMQMDSTSPGGPLVNLLTLKQSSMWFFKTREGGMGILQITGFTENPRGVKIRYKLVKNSATNPSASQNAANNTAPLFYQWQFINTNPPAAPNLSFGPVVERVITPVAPNPDGFVYVNLEKNELMTSPVTLNDARAGGDPVPHTARFFQWINDSNANFAVYLRGTNVGLVPLGTRMFYRIHGRGNRDEFAQWTPLEVRSLVTDQEGPSGYGAMQKAPSDFGAMDGPLLAFPKLPASYVIQTWQGAVGILQIAGFTNNPPGVKIRYKLVQNANSSSGTDSPTLAEQPPVVVETFPVSGARDVVPGETEIRVRFSKPMADGSWSWSTAWENSTPESIGDPHYLDDQRTCLLKVRLEPGHSYAWWLNSEQFKNFRDRAGQPAVPYLLTFETKSN